METLGRQRLHAFGAGCNRVHVPLQSICMRRAQDAVQAAAQTRQPEPQTAGQRLWGGRPGQSTESSEPKKQEETPVAGSCHLRSVGSSPWPPKIRTSSDLVVTWPAAQAGRAAEAFGNNVHFLLQGWASPSGGGARRALAAAPARCQLYWHSLNVQGETRLRRRGRACCVAGRCAPGFRAAAAVKLKS